MCDKIYRHKRFWVINFIIMMFAGVWSACMAGASLFYAPW